MCVDTVIQYILSVFTEIPTRVWVQMSGMHTHRCGVGNMQLATAVSPVREGGWNGTREWGIDPLCAGFLRGLTSYVAAATDETSLVLGSVYADAVPQITNGEPEVRNPV